MYTPDAFAETRRDVLEDAIGRIGFSTLVTADADGILATHLPLVLDAAAGTLSGHFARPNPHWKRAPGAALAMFLGPHFYVSPSWYPSKQEGGKVVPTWNYIAVHVRGTITLHDDAMWLRDHLERLTAANELGRDHPWSVGDAPESYIAAMMRGIVGFELAITAIEGKWKLSQNRNQADRSGVRTGLQAVGQGALADLMDGG